MAAAERHLACPAPLPACRLGQAQQALAIADAEKGSLQQQVVKLQQQLALAHSKAAKASWAADAAVAEKMQAAAAKAGSSSTRQQLQVGAWLCCLAVLPGCAAWLCCLAVLPGCAAWVHNLLRCLCTVVWLVCAAAQ